MNKVIALFVSVILVLSSIGYAHPDLIPDINIIALTGLGGVVDEVDTDVVIRIEAEDEGFNAGISSIQLFEGGSLIHRKECFFTLDCDVDVAVHRESKGKRTYTAIVIDAGRNSRTKVIAVNFLGKEQPPELRFVEDVEVEEGSRVILDIGAFDRNNDVVSITARDLPPGARFESNLARGRFEWIPNFTQSGTHRIIFTAVDSLNQKDSKALVIKVINKNLQPDVIFFDKEKRISIDEGRSRKFSVAIKDTDKKKPDVEWRLDGKIVSTSETFVYRPDFDDEGRHSLVARVIDLPFVLKNEWPITVNDINRKPELRRILDRDVDEDDKIRFTIFATDKDVDKISYSALGLPRGASFDSRTRTFSWDTKEGDAGNYFITFKATDEKGLFDSETARIKVVRELKTSHEKYHDFLRQLELQKRQREQEKLNATETVRFDAPQTRPVCNAGYLCYVIAYLLR